MAIHNHQADSRFSLISYLLWWLRMTSSSEPHTQINGSVIWVVVLYNGMWYKCCVKECEQHSVDLYSTTSQQVITWTIWKSLARCTVSIVAKSCRWKTTSQMNKGGLISLACQYSYWTWDSGTLKVGKVSIVTHNIYVCIPVRKVELPYAITRLTAYSMYCCMVSDLVISALHIERVWCDTECPWQDQVLNNMKLRQSGQVDK